MLEVYKIDLFDSSINDYLDNVLAYLNTTPLSNTYNETKRVLFSIINDTNLSFTHLPTFDKVVRMIIIVSALYSLYVSYTNRLIHLDKDRSNKEVRALLVLEAMRYAEDKIAKDNTDKVNEFNGIIEPRLDYMESHLYNMSNDLDILKKLCHQMNERTLTFGSLVGATWNTGSVYHSDTVTVNYNLIDILTSDILESKQATYTCLTIKGVLSENAEITIPPGTKIIVTKAVRLSRGMRDLASGYDVTAEAKDALETCMVKMPR